MLRACLECHRSQAAGRPPRLPAKNSSQGSRRHASGQPARPSWVPSHGCTGLKWSDGQQLKKNRPEVGLRARPATNKAVDPTNSLVPVGKGFAIETQALAPSCTKQRVESYLAWREPGQRAQPLLREFKNRMRARISTAAASRHRIATPHPYTPPCLLGFDCCHHQQELCTLPPSTQRHMHMMDGRQHHRHLPPSPHTAPSLQTAPPCSPQTS